MMIEFIYIIFVDTQYLFYRLVGIFFLWWIGWFIILSTPKGQHQHQHHQHHHQHQHHQHQHHQHQDQHQHQQHQDQHDIVIPKAHQSIHNLLDYPKINKSPRYIEETCVVCLNNLPNILIFPCMHQCLCRDELELIYSCPICRHQITAYFLVSREQENGSKADTTRKRRRKKKRRRKM